MGYRTVRALRDGWLWHTGETMRGHEFHHSVWRGRPTETPFAYELLPGTDQHAHQREGACVGSLIASYTHLHFLARPELAGRMVRAAALPLPPDPLPPQGEGGEKPKRLL